MFNLSASTSTSYSVYNQSLILNDKFEIDHEKLDVEGLPYLTATYVAYLITTNMGMTATFVYMLLWNWDDLKAAWNWASPTKLRKLFSAQGLYFWRNQETPEERLRRKENDPEIDPHYKLMLRNKYVEVPLWWWTLVIVICWAVGLGCLYALEVRVSYYIFDLFFGIMLITL
jgi:OPT oligopeptide transporter protein